MYIYIFVDFDGVTHKENGLRFERAAYLAQVLSQYDTVRIVFSTSWREYAPLERLRDYMPVSIQDKCIGKTPVIKDVVTHPRYREILAYNEEHGISNGQWIALDDMKCLFPPNLPNLILVNPKTGFTKIEAKLLNEKIKIMMNKNKPNPM